MLSFGCDEDVTSLIKMNMAMTIIVRKILTSVVRIFFNNLKIVNLNKKIILKHNIFYIG